MKLRFSITTKIALGFGVLTILYAINLFFIYNTLEKNQKDNKQLLDIYLPSINHIEKLQYNISQWKLLLKNWVCSEKENITPDKLKLIEIIEIEIPQLQKLLLKVYHEWPLNEQVIINQVFSLINDSLIISSREIMSILNNPQAYIDNANIQHVEKKLGNSGDILGLTSKIESKIAILLNTQQERVLNIQTQMQVSVEKARTFIITSTLLLIFLAFIIAFITIRSQVLPINYIKTILIQMGKGILPNEKIKETRDEIGEIAAALNSLVKGLKKISTFSIEIGKGNFNWSFEPLSKDDILGNSLIKMREELRNAAIEEQKRKKEDEQRNWATQGIAKFSEILRQNNNNLTELSSNLISNLVNYLGANQGGIFIVDEDKSDNVIIELTSCYAYDRQKFIQKSFNPGEGLIGRCYLERQTIFLTDIPKDYITITSGLGEATPTCLLIVPLMHNDIVYGVIEIASFKVFEPYQIEFIERIATSIASTISIVKINIHTTRLLEQSRKQAEDMASHEEELRQNMEEIRTTQEESERREIALKKQIEELRKRLEKYETQ